jgi:hypothetical protein
MSCAACSTSSRPYVLVDGDGTYHVECREADRRIIDQQLDMAVGARGKVQGRIRGVPIAPAIASATRC